MRRITLIANGLILTAGMALAGRPLEIDDADPLDVGNVQIEAGAAAMRDPDWKHWDFPVGVTYGAIHSIEIGIGFSEQFEKRREILDEQETAKNTRVNGVGDLTLGGKWRIIESSPLGARHALAPSVKFPTASDDKELGSGKTDYDLTWITSRAMGDNVGVHFNFGYSWIGGKDDDVIHYGLSLDYLIADPVQCVGEIYAENELNGDSDTAAQFNIGLRWTPVECLTLDMAAGSRVHGEAPEFTATAGLTWVFGLITEND